ncbi:MAG TPA: hypothetical protein VKK31_15210 [Thermoanaerobaculia bacterium]|nr:hypothetical protein [Thermoanaerobaculia bacterium]
MSRTPFIRLLGLSLALLLAACAAFQAQHQGAAPSHDHDHAHAAVIPPPGEFSELAEDGQIARIRGEVEEVKANLARQGRYSCCVHPACNECLLKYGQCHCRDVVRDEGPCCGECTEAWIEGRGTVEGVNAWDLLERKKKMLDDANRKGSGQGGGESEERPPHRHHH